MAIMPNRRLRVGIEHIPALTVLMQQDTHTDGHGDALDSQGIVLITGDGRLGAYFLL